MNNDPSLLPDERLDYINENLSLIQLRDGLTFGTDAYLLSAFVRGGGRGADLGSGTGVAAFLCLVRDKLKSACAVELQPRFAELIGRNAALNGLSDRVSVICGDVRELTAATVGGPLDTVLANPPYLKAGEGFDSKTNEKNTARRELNGTVADFCAAASRILRFGGAFYTVYRPDRLTDLFAALSAASLEPKRMVTVYTDEFTAPSLVLVESKKGAAPSLVCAPPLIVYRTGTRDYTENMTRVYDECSLEFLFRRRT